MLYRCSLHFGQSLTEPDYDIYLEGLSDVDDISRIQKALEECLKRCEFMPRLKNIREHLPAAVVLESTDLPTVGTPHCKIVRDWYEPMNERVRLHYFGFEDGTRQVRVEKISA